MLCDKKGTRALAPVRRPPRRGVRSAALPAHPPPNPPPVPVQPHAPSSSPGAFSVNQTRPSPVRLPQRRPLRHLRILPVLAAISVVSASSFLRSVGVASPSRCSPILGGVPLPAPVCSSRVRSSGAHYDTDRQPSIPFQLSRASAGASGD